MRRVRSRDSPSRPLRRGFVSLRGPERAARRTEARRAATRVRPGRGPGGGRRGRLTLQGSHFPVSGSESTPHLGTQSPPPAPAGSAARQTGFGFGFQSFHRTSGNRRRSTSAQRGCRRVQGRRPGLQNARALPRSPEAGHPRSRATTPTTPTWESSIPARAVWPSRGPERRLRVLVTFSPTTGAHAAFITSSQARSPDTVSEEARAPAPSAVRAPARGWRGSFRATAGDQARG